MSTSDIVALEWNVPELQKMKKYPTSLFYKGDVALLKKRKISIVGSRKPNQYTRQLTARLAQSLSQRDVCIVSGAAMGVDAIAHKSAGASQTIAVMANGLDIRYPAVNKSLIEEIENQGLVLSQFEAGSKARSWSFVVRNELVVALGEALIVTQADLESGTMRSVAYALAMGTPIYVLPHRIGESEGTQKLLADNKAEAIYDIERFCEGFGALAQETNDDFLHYCQTNPSYEEALASFGDRVLEYELEGKIVISNATIHLR
jgi:DNA processing protein